jgi:hypothetical protein
MEAVRQARHKQEFQEDYTAANGLGHVKEWRRKSQGEGTLRRGAAKRGLGLETKSQRSNNNLLKLHYRNTVSKRDPFLVK